MGNNKHILKLRNFYSSNRGAPSLVEAKMALGKLHIETIQGWGHANVDTETQIPKTGSSETPELPPGELKSPEGRRRRPGMAMEF